jgi:hypothetical protein
MSTPREEEVEGRVRAARALGAWADALDALRVVGIAADEDLRLVTMRHGDEVSGPAEAAKIRTVLQMVAPLREEARVVADLWARVAIAERSEREAHRELHGKEAP